MSAAGKRYWVYVLYSEDAGRFYIGLSEDVEKRLGEHNSGKSCWTSRHVPWRCVFCRELRCLSEARTFENLLKRQKRGNGFFRLTGLQPDDLGGESQC